MATTINLGKNFTITSGLTNVTDLTMTRSGDKIDVTTRGGTKPLRHTRVGLPKITFECSVLAEAATTYAIGGSISLVCAEYTGTVIVLDAERTEGEDGLVQYRVTMTPGTASAETVVI